MRDGLVLRRRGRRAAALVVLGSLLPIGIARRAPVTVDQVVAATPRTTTGAAASTTTSTAPGHAGATTTSTTLAGGGSTTTPTTTATTTVPTTTATAPATTYTCTAPPATTTTTTTAAFPSTSTSSTSPALPGGVATTTTTTTAGSGLVPAYYLVESNGAVFPFGGAVALGSESDHRLTTIVVAAAVTPGDRGYWLLTARGNLYNFGDAVDYGSPVHAAHLGTFAGMAATPDGRGFLVVTSAGDVYHYGDAVFCGSPVHDTLSGKVAGVVYTPDGNGYWVYTTGGTVYAFGDAHSHGSGRGPAGSPAVGMAATPDGDGYWLAYADGAVRQFGDAHFFGSAAHLHLSAPIAGFAGAPDGGGYRLVGRSGRMYQFGDAAFHGSLAHTPPAAPVTVVAVLATTAPPPPPPPTTTTSTTSTTTTSTTSTTTSTLPRPTTTTSPRRTTTTRPPPTTTTTIPLPPLKGDPYVHGATGYDISDFQCTRRGAATAQARLPGSTGLAVIQVAGWLDDSPNSCLGAEVRWARRVTAEGDPYALYLFMNSPDASAAAARQDADGPAGRCAALPASRRAACRAYNYGYNGAGNALAYANAVGARSSLWWMDVENAALARGEYSDFAAGEYWSSSKALNDGTIQGAIDALRKAGVTVGIYSTSLQYPHIAGNYIPAGRRLPLWVAGVPWTKPPYSERGLPSPAVLAAWCAGVAHYAGSKARDLFAGGAPWLLQETPGNLPSPFGIDPDYAC